MGARSKEAKPGEYRNRKKRHDHAHFQKSILMIKDYENHFVWSDEEQKFVAKDNVESNFISRVLHNPQSSDF